MSDQTSAPENISYSKVNEDVMRSLTHTTWRYWLALGFLFCIVIGGAAVYYTQTIFGLGIWGTNEPIYWGFDIPNFIFWIGFSLSGTLLSAILLLTKSHWRNAIYRTAEMLTGFALMTASIVILTHVGRAWRAWYMFPIPNTRQLWTNFRSPLMADVFGIITYLGGSVLFLIVGSIPDFAALRDHCTGWRKRLYTVLAFGWRGTDEQWRHFRRAYLLIAVTIIPVAITMHSVTSWVPALTTNPGHHSTIFPPYFVIGALVSGVAGVLMVLILVRRFLNFKEYIKLVHVDNLAKMLLVASMSITYVYLIEVFIPAYKAENFELMPLLARMFGGYSPLFWFMVGANSLIPLTLFFRNVRRNTVALFLICAGIQVAMFFERFLMIIPALSIGYLPFTWVSYSPTWIEFALVSWSVAVFCFLMLVGVKIIPAVSIFEVKELLKIPRRSESGLDDPQFQQPVAVPDGEAAHERASPGLVTHPSSAHARTCIATFEYLDDALAAVKKLKADGFSKIQVQSPVPVHEIDDVTYTPTPLRLRLSSLLDKWRLRDVQVARFTVLGAAGGGTAILALAAGTAVLYPIPTSGLPILAMPTIIFTTLLMADFFGLVGSVVGFFILAKLPSYKKTPYHPSVSYDRFGVVVNSLNDYEMAKTMEVLKQFGTANVYDESEVAPIARQ